MKWLQGEDEAKSNLDLDLDLGPASEDFEHESAGAPSISVRSFFQQGYGIDAPPLGISRHPAGSFVLIASLLNPPEYNPEDRMLLALWVAERYW